MGHNAQAVVRKMSRDLPKTKRALAIKDQQSNEQKEQFYSPNAQVLKFWKVCHPKYGGDVTDQAKDLGICQRAIHRKSEMRAKRLSVVTPMCSRIGALAVPPKKKVTLVKTGLYPKVVYGCEVDVVTVRQTVDVRRSVVGAVFG